MECSASAAELKYDGGGEVEYNQEEITEWIRENMAEGGEFYPWSKDQLNEAMENFCFGDIAKVLELGDYLEAGKCIANHVLVYFNQQAVLAAMDRDIGRHNVD